MFYDFRCSSCGNVQEEECSVDTFKEYTPKCGVCGEPCAYEFNPQGVQFVLKDGPSGSWPSKGERFKKFRAKSSQSAARRQRERYGENTGAIPNYKGKEADSWQEARSEALRDAGPEVAATFDDKVSAESPKIS